jgi:hypothetical protein
MVLAHSHFRPLLRPRSSRDRFLASPGPLGPPFAFPGRFFGSPFSSKVGRPSLSKASFLTLWHPLGPKTPPTGARDSLKHSPNSLSRPFLSFSSPACSTEDHFCNTLQWFWHILTFAPCCVQGPLGASFSALLAPLGLPLRTLAPPLGTHFPKN